LRNGFTKFVKLTTFLLGGTVFQGKIDIPPWRNGFTNFVKLNDFPPILVSQLSPLSYQCRLPPPPPPPPLSLLPSLDTERITSVPGIITSATPRLIFIPSRITTPTVKNAPNYMTVTQWFSAITS